MILKYFLSLILVVLTKITDSDSPPYWDPSLADHEQWLGCHWADSHLTRYSSDHFSHDRSSPNPAQWQELRRNDVLGSGGWEVVIMNNNPVLYIQ